MWTLRPGDFPAEFQDPRIEMSGVATVSFDGTTMTTGYDGFGTRVTMTVEEQALTIDTAMQGQVVAPYTATAEVLSVSPDVDVTGLTADTTATLNGEAFPMPGLDEFPTYEVPLGGESDYTCDDTTLTITPTAGDVQAPTMVLTRV